MWILAAHEIFQSYHLRLADGDGAAAAGQLSSIGKRLRDEKHVLLKIAHFVSLARPEIEVVASVDGAADRAGLLLSLAPHGEVLGEGSGSFDRGLVYTLSSVEGVVVALRSEVAAQGPWLAGSEHVP